MNEKQTRPCQGCQAIFTYQSELEHYQQAGIARYGVASPECSVQFFEILDKERMLFGYPAVHRLIVDAYSVQHPPHNEYQKALNIEPRLIAASIQSIAVHLIALYLAIEKKIELRAIPKFMDKILTHMSQYKIEFPEIDAPVDLGSIKVIDINKAMTEDVSLAEYEKLSWQWAESAWQAWAQHHALVREWFKQYSK